PKTPKPREILFIINQLLKCNPTFKMVLAFRWWRGFLFGLEALPFAIRGRSSLTNSFQSPTEFNRSQG
ncbi:MAG: hypothetical protein ACKO96_39550, partial [Flammeovirgaceae bacterium]